MTIQEMKSRKKELGFTNQDLADRSGVPLSTVNKLFSGSTSHPRRSTVLALEAVLMTAETSHPLVKYDVPNYFDSLRDLEIPYMAGTSAKAKVQGEYTLEDYLGLPEDMRVELIDGVFYDIAAPSVVHQLIATHIGHQLMRCVEEHNGPCKPILSPIDVQLDKDDKTVVQPDVLILCSPEVLIRSGRIFGAPDFIIEILSLSTRKKDMILKLAKYANAGVREYWIIDPEKLKVTVYDFEHYIDMETYRFTDCVPVRIWNGDFSVDFRKVYDYIRDYLETAPL